MKKAFAALLASFIFFSTFSAAFADDMDKYRTGYPWINSCLQGVLTEDIVASTSLSDDFYTAVNGRKIIDTVFAPGYSQAGTMIDKMIAADSDIEALFINRVKDPDDQERLAYNYYDLFLDWDSRNAAGVTPLREEIDSLESLDSIDALLDYMANVPFSEQAASLIDVVTTNSFEDSNKKIIAIDIIPQVILDDSAEYSELTELGTIKKEAYTELAAVILSRLGYSQKEAEEKIENAFAFESLVADLVPSVEAQNSPDFLSSINNHYKRDELIELSGALPVIQIVEDNMGFPAADDYLVTVPALFERINGLLKEENLTMIRDYLIVLDVLSSASWLDRECYDCNYDCINKISGVADKLEDSVIAAGKASSTFAWATARLYTEAYLKQEDKDRISDLVDKTLDKYHEVIMSADFLSDETKALSIKKLDSITKKILWPDDWSLYDCEGLTIRSPEEGGILFNENRVIFDYSIRKMVKEYSEERNPEEWLVTPQTFNCMYSQQDNTVYVLGAFAVGDMYNSEMSDEQLYGALGTVIGHEISHAFDSVGAQFDMNGNMTVWWTEEDIAAFYEKNDRLIEYLSGMYPWEGEKFLAGIFSGEACADMGGMKVMLLLAAEKDDFDYDEFFRSNANMWIRVRNLQSMRSALLTDPHPLEYIRVNTTMQQFDEFLDCYGIHEGDGMYLAPENRVNIW